MAVGLDSVLTLLQSRLITIYKTIRTVALAIKGTGSRDIGHQIFFSLIKRNRKEGQHALEEIVNRLGLGPTGSRSRQDTLESSIQRSQPLLHTGIVLNGRWPFTAPRPEAAVAWSYHDSWGCVPSSSELRTNR